MSSSRSCARWNSSSIAHGLALEQAGIADAQPVALDHEAVDLAPAEAEAGQREARRPLLLLLERGAEDPGQRAHVLGDQVVALHEALDRPHPVALAVAHAPGDLGLQVEGQPVLGAAGQVVQMAAHGPQEAARAQEA